MASIALSREPSTARWSLALVCFWLVVPAPALAQGSLGPRGTFDWRDYAALPESAWSGTIVVKLSEEDAQGDAGLDSRVQETIARIEALAPRGSILRVSRGFGRDPQWLASMRSRGEARCRCRLADLASYLTITFERSAVDLASLLSRINASAAVEVAYPVPSRASLLPPVDIPPATPDFSGSQGYLGSAPDGIDADFALTLPGGGGDNVRVADLEGDWDEQHEDLDACVGALVDVGGTIDESDPEFTNHGTAVLSELFGGYNDYGVSGIVPDARCYFVPDYTIENGLDWPGALLAASDALAEPGSVILMESQTSGPRYDPESESQFGLVPTEWEPAVYDTVRTVVASGFIVVAAAGNGEQDLDDPLYEGRFDRSSHDSGAIIVGAGMSPMTGTARAPCSFTNYGDRVDLQGWGTDVAAAGYGDLFDGGGDVHQAYTAYFSGTSSASPIVAGAVAALVSAAREAGLEELSPREVRDVLVTTGTPQAADPAHIGPLPNLRAALGSVIQFCGDGTVNGDGEICDDGNEIGGDGCSADCSSDETCGNGITDLEVDEVCDDGNEFGGDGCSADCLSDETCGNGITDVDAGERCDDGNTVGLDGCAADCSGNEACGNGTVDRTADEVCDDGNEIGGDGCSADCRSDETCGNGIIDLESGEQCDDGNEIGGDGCSADCRSDETCGNGITDLESGEQCDDGNAMDRDGCSSLCIVEEAYLISAPPMFGRTGCLAAGAGTPDLAPTVGWLVLLLLVARRARR